MKLLLTSFVLSFVLGSSAIAESYFLDTTGGSWTDPCNWSGGEEPNDIVVYIGASPNSPDGAWAVLDSEVMDVCGLTIGSSGTGRLDVDGGTQSSILDVNGPWFAAVGSGSVANINVTGGHINATYDPNSQWGVDGTVNYVHTNGWVEVEFNNLAINPGSVVNITATGGWLEMHGDPTALNGQLNIDLDGDVWLILNDVDTSSDTHITLNGDARMTVTGDWEFNTSMDGILTSNGTIKARWNTYGDDSEETLLWIECENPLPADINEDCIVDLRDLALFVKDWLDDTTP